MAPPRLSPTFSAKRMVAKITPVVRRPVFHSPKSATSANIAQISGMVGA